jgi:hypothetical protein
MHEISFDDCCKNCGRADNTWPDRASTGRAVAHQTSYQVRLSLEGKTRFSIGLLIKGAIGRRATRLSYSPEPIDEANSFGFCSRVKAAEKCYAVANIKRLD